MGFENPPVREHLTAGLHGLLGTSHRAGSPCTLKAESHIANEPRIPQALLDWGVAPRPSVGNSAWDVISAL